MMVILDVKWNWLSLVSVLVIETQHETCFGWKDGWCISAIQWSVNITRSQSCSFWISSSHFIWWHQGASALQSEGSAVWVKLENADHIPFTAVAQSGPYVWKLCSFCVQDFTLHAVDTVLINCCLFFAGCTDDLIFETKTVDVGDYVPADHLIMKQHCFGSGLFLENVQLSLGEHLPLITMVLKNILTFLPNRSLEVLSCILMKQSWRILEFITV